jgi:hypothetical protein
LSGIKQSTFLTCILTVFFLQALACELSARHYCEKKCGPDLDKARDKALSLYRQAENCYKEWGSPKKVIQMKEAIRMIVEEGKSPA